MTTNPQAWSLERPLVRHGVAFGFAALALALRLLRLDAQPLWFDEALSLHIATAADGMDFIHNTAPLYHVLTRWWCGVFGNEVAGLRSLSAVAGAAFVWASFHTAREVFGDRAALAAATVAMLSPLHLYYSQEARAYALLLLFLMVAFWMLWRLANDGSRATWVTLVAASAMALFTHYLAAIPLAIGFVGIGGVRRDAQRPAPIKAALAAGIVAVVLVVPWLWWWRRHTPFDPSDMQWLSVLWQQLSVPGAVASSLELFVIGGQLGHAPIFLKQQSTLVFPELLREAALFMVMGIAVAAALRVGRWRRVEVLQCSSLLFGPLLALLLISTVRAVYCPGRYDLIAFPAFVLLGGYAIATATTAGIRVGKGAVTAGLGTAVAVLLVAVVAKDIAYFGAEAGQEPGPKVAECLIDNVKPDELVIACGEVALPVLARLEQRGFRWREGTCRRAEPPQQFGLRMLPLGLETAPGAVSRYERAMADGSLVADLGKLVEGSPAAGLWLVLSEQLRSVPTPEVERLGQQLFDCTQHAGFKVISSDRESGIVHLRRQR